MYIINLTTRKPCRDRDQINCMSPERYMTNTNKEAQIHEIITFKYLSVSVHGVLEHGELYILVRRFSEEPDCVLVRFLI